MFGHGTPALRAQGGAPAEGAGQPRVRSGPVLGVRPAGAAGAQAGAALRAGPGDARHQRPVPEPVQAVPVDAALGADERSRRPPQ